jgi:hypothetical protein
MTVGKRLSVRQLLIDDGFPLPWVSAYTAVVSRVYFHDVMKGVGMRKDARGAVYTDADAAGLLQVARGLRDAPSSADPARADLAVCRNDVCPMWMTTHAGECE